MAYSTIANMIERYGEGELIGLTDRGAIATGVIDESVVEKALTSASDKVDGFLAVRYALPLSDTPPLISGLVEVLAYWDLHPSEPDEKLKTDHKEALSTLRDISQGKVKLDVDGVEPDGNGSTGARFTDRQRPFDPGKMSGFI